MSKLKSIGLSILLTLAVACFCKPEAAAQTSITQVPTTCTNYTVYLYTPPGGSFTGTPLPGLYYCLGNALLAYGKPQILMADVSATTTATPFITFPVLANTNYTFSCELYWQNSATNADTVTITTPASPTSVTAFAFSVVATGINGNVFSGSPLALNTAAAGAGGTTYLDRVSGTIQNGSTAGNVVFEINGASGTGTAKANTSCNLTPTP